MGSHGTLAVHIHHPGRETAKPDGAGRGRFRDHPGHPVQGRRSPPHHRLGSERSRRAQAFFLRRPAPARGRLSGSPVGQLAGPERGAGTGNPARNRQRESPQATIQHARGRAPVPVVELLDSQGWTAGRHPLGGTRFQGVEPPGFYTHTGHLHHRWQDEVPGGIRDLRRRGPGEPGPFHPGIQTPSWTVLRR